MKIRSISNFTNLSAIAALAVWVTPAAVRGGTYTNDFSSDVLTGATVYGNEGGDGTAGVIENGVLKLTKAEGSKQGGFVIDDLDAGAAVSAFTVTFDLLIGGGSGADGFSFSFGPDIADGGISEEGSGSGLIVAFD